MDSYEHLGAMLQTLTLARKDVYLLGDFKCDVLNTGDVKNLQRVLDQYNFHQCVSKPTQITEETSACLDLVTTNRPELVKSTASLPFSASDHNLVTCRLVLDKNPTSQEPVNLRFFKNFSEMDFLKDLWDAPFQSGGDGR